MGVLDGAKVCDSVVCVAGSEGLDAVGERLLSAGMVTFYSTLGILFDNVSSLRSLDHT